MGKHLPSEPRTRRNPRECTTCDSDDAAQECQRLCCELIEVIIMPNIWANFILTESAVVSAFGPYSEGSDEPSCASETASGRGFSHDRDDPFPSYDLASRDVDHYRDHRDGVDGHHPVEKSYHIDKYLRGVVSTQYLHRHHDGGSPGSTNDVRGDPATTFAENSGFVPNDRRWTFGSNRSSRHAWRSCCCRPS